MYVYQFFAIISSASEVCDVCEAENKATETTCTCPEMDNTAAIIGGVVAIVLIVAVTTVIVILGIVVLLLRNRSGSYSTSKTRYACQHNTHYLSTLVWLCAEK